MNEIKFTCPVCGQKISSDRAHAGTVLNCPSCQNHIGVPSGFDDAPRPISPPAVPPLAPPPLRTGPMSALAVASLICSLASLVTCIGWLPGIICGHLARAKIRRNPLLRGRGIATAGLVIGYAMLILAVTLVTVGWVRFGPTIQQQYRQVWVESAMTPSSSTATVAVAEFDVGSNTVPLAVATPVPEPSPFGWTLDLKDASFPDTPLGGKLHGLDFAVKRVIYANGNLKINSTTPGMSVTLLGVGTSVKDSDQDVQAASSNGVPVVVLNWNDDGVAGTARFTGGYALKLKFTAAAKHKTRGQIYLCLPDEENSYIAGSFAVTFSKKKPAQ